MEKASRTCGSAVGSGRVVLIGGNGFVGSNIRRLLGDGAVAPPEDAVNLTDPDSLRAALQPGDVIINAAGYANATDTTERGRRLLRAVNVDGVGNLARAAADVNAAQLIHISSVAAMGRQHAENITEDMMEPVASPYAQSKLAGEQILAGYFDRLPITILRPTSVFGPGRGLAAVLCKAVSKGTVPLPGGGDARIPFTYIDNVARGVALTVGNARCYGRTFIVGDPESYSVRDIVLALARAMGIKPRIVAVPCGVARVGAMACELLAKMRGSSPLLDRGRLETLTCSVSYSIAALRAATGYEPLYDLNEAAERIVSWYAADRE